MSWTAEQIPDLSGHTAIVTGGNSGIGRYAAAALSAAGASVVLACRNVAAAQEVARELTGTVRVEALDLASLASVRDFADRWSGPLDLLVNNAGVMTPPRRRETDDGFELQFGTNHLGHFALTGLLLPALLESENPRVTTVSSLAHTGGDHHVLEGNAEGKYSAQKAYSQSKLANLLFARELARRAAAAGSPLVSTAAHPGVSATNLFAAPDGLGALPVLRQVVPLVTRVLFQPAKAGALPILYAATVAEPGSYTGPQRLRESRGPVGPATLSPYAVEQALGEALWDRSEEWTSVRFEL